MLSERIQSLENALKQGDKAELEALKAIAKSIEGDEARASELALLSPESFEDVLKELAGRKNIAQLVQISGLTLDKEKRKILKSFLHRLRSAGVEIPEKVEAKKVVAGQKMLSEWAMATPAMLLSGQQVGYYFLGGRTANVFLVSHFDLEQGIVNFRNFHGSEKRARRVAQQTVVTDDFTVPVISIPGEHFFRLLAAGLSKTRNNEIKSELRSGLSRLKIELSVPGEKSHPGFEPQELEKLRGDRSRLYQSDRLLEHPYFKHWEFDPETIDACSKELEDASHSPLQLSESQFLERMERIFLKFCLSGLDKNRQRIRSGLLENAYLMRLGQDADLAQTAIALALSLEEKTEPADFFRKILIRSFPEAWKKLGQKSSSLIISAR